MLNGILLIPLGWIVLQQDALKGRQAAVLESLDRAERFIHCLGDFRAAPTFQESQDDDLALFWCDQFQGV